MLPEERARVKIDKQLNEAGWNIVDRDEYVPFETVAVREALMQGNTESDYLLFIDNKAIAVVEAKREENNLDEDVERQAEGYSTHPQSWYGLWFEGFIPLVYMANGNKIVFKNMLDADSDYEELSEMHSPKKMLQIIGKTSEYGALPYLTNKGLRECQYNAEVSLEKSLKNGNKKNLAVLATGAGKTYLACMASYRLLNYTATKRVLFLVDRNNLGRQAESEFSLFDMTEKRQPMSSLYQIKRLRHESDIDADIVISTIQKLFAILTGQQITDSNEDAEDEEATKDEDRESAGAEIQLGDNLRLPPDYFQFIVVDECHRSIYGKWQSVLKYFKDAKILGLTATPTEEAYAFFNRNIVENYTYDDSVVDGVNVPSRVYRIATANTEDGGIIREGSDVVETTHKNGTTYTYNMDHDVSFVREDLDRSVTNKDQIRKVLSTYKDAIYTDLYPEREKKWEYIPKTLIFAKDDNHATQIVEIAKEVFKDEFDGNTPEHFVQKITYAAGDSNALIRDFRTERDFRIAVTVTLVATGTDVKPLEVVLFMRDVISEVLYTQMKGRGCRSITDDKFTEITPNATTKDCYYIVDAVGVTEHEHLMPTGGWKIKGKTLSLVHLLEHLAHGELSDENLALLRNYCSTINRRYEDNALFGKHLDSFIDSFGFAPRTLAHRIQEAFDNNSLEEFVSPSNDNATRRALIDILMSNISARKKLIEMQRGYSITIDEKDTVLYAGFSKETAQSFIDNFEKCLEDNKDTIEALRIIYNSEDTLITYTMLTELRDRLLSESGQFGIYNIWKNYKILDEDGNVDELDTKYNVNALTNLIQIVRYAYKKNQRLTSLIVGYAQKFSLYCGQNQRILTKDQVEIMRQIAEYIINDGAITALELNSIDTDLWRRGVQSFSAQELNGEMNTLAKFILRTA
ncbi:type I restriction enzyme, R subunit [Lachnospiraceae bacterium YSD2013]|nr:type I restriction enzyme, R subunit [Lachnospiraceae bacterium YSD2013]